MPSQERASAVKGSISSRVNNAKAGSIHIEAEPSDWHLLQAFKFCKKLHCPSMHGFAFISPRHRYLLSTCIVIHNMRMLMRCAN